MSSYYTDNNIKDQSVIGSSTASDETRILFFEINDNDSTKFYSAYHDEDFVYELPESDIYQPLFIHDNKRDSKLEKSISTALENLQYNYPYNKKIKNRLLDLIDIDEMEDWEAKPSLGSIKYFIGFINAYKPKYPDIVISPQGNTKVEWYTNNDNLFTIEFFPNGDCRFLCFSTNLHNPERVNRISGQITVDTLDDYLEKKQIKRLTLI